MPIKRFWMFSEAIDRMNSAKDIRAINVAAAVLGEDSYVDTMEKLTESLGEVARYDGNTMAEINAIRDPNATQILRSLM